MIPQTLMNACLRHCLQRSPRFLPIQTLDTADQTQFQNIFDLAKVFQKLNIYVCMEGQDAEKKHCLKK